MEEMLTTAQVAEELGISERTLLRWLYAGEIAEPRRVGTIRLWTKAEVRIVKAYKEANFRKRL